MKKPSLRTVLVVTAALGLTAVGVTQIRQAIKILGVGAAVTQFGPEMNRAINNLTGRRDTNTEFTKVVPILTVGLNSRGAIGAAQVKGSRRNVERVKAVAAPEVELFGEIMVRAMIPIATDNPTDARNLRAVEGVGVSGIVDLRL